MIKSTFEYAQRALGESWKIIFFVFAFGLTANTQAADRGKYRVYVGPTGYAPFIIVDNKPTGTVYSGVAIDILDAFEKSFPKYSRSYTMQTRKRANQLLKTGEIIDVMLHSPYFIDREVLAKYDFSRTIFVTRDVVVTLDDQNFIYTKPGDLLNKSVGVLRGYSYGVFDQLFASGKVHDYRVNHHHQAISMLNRRRVDAYLGNVHVSPHYIKELGLKLSKFKFSEKALFEFDLAFLVTNRKPELQVALNEFIRTAAADGRLDKIIGKYIK